MDNEMTNKEFIENVMKENNNILKGMIPKSTDEEVQALVTSIINELGAPIPPEQEKKQKRRYTDRQIRNTVSEILNTLDN